MSHGAAAGAAPKMLRKYRLCRPNSELALSADRIGSRVRSKKSSMYSLPAHPKQQPLAAPVRPPGPHGSSACCRSRSRRAHDLREVIFTRARGQHVFLGVKYVDSHRPVDRPPRLCSTRRPSGRVDLATFGRQRSMLVTRSGCPWTLGRQGQQEPTCRAGGAREDECHGKPLAAAARGP